MVGRQTPLLALFVPLILVGMVDGMRGVRQAWPAAVVGGFVFAIAPVRLLELHLGRADRHRRLAALHRRDRRAAPGLAAERAAPRRARAARARRSPAPPSPTRARGRGPAQGRRPRSRGEILGAYAPYLIIIAVFSVAQWGPIKDSRSHDGLTVNEFAWPGLDIATPTARRSAATFKFNWANAAGTLLLVAGLLTMLVLRVAPAARCASSAHTLDQLKWATLTVATVLRSPT